MAKDNNKIKSDLSSNIIKLLESEDGIQAKLSKSINKTSSYFSELKRGKPVNALHLTAVGIVCGPQKVLELMSLDNTGVLPQNLIDQKALKTIITEVEKRLSDENKVLAPEMKAELITVLYEYCVDSGREVDDKMVGSYLRLVK